MAKVSIMENKINLKETILNSSNKNPKELIDGFYGDYRWLSNYEPCEIKIGNYTYPTSEHAYQSMKTFVEEEKLLLTTNTSPNWARKTGQNLTLRPDWNKVKIDCMEFCLKEKFKEGTLLGEKLKETYPAVLIPKIWWHDNFWESCLCEKCGDKGLNNLGILIEGIRNNLMKIL